MTSPAASPSLAHTYQDYRRAHPDVRIRDAATALGVSEGQLVACQSGNGAPANGSTDGQTGVTRLRSEFPALLQALPALGRVMALTRNEHAVIEKHGTYGGISFHGPMGLVICDAIDLRLFMGRWHHAFAVSEPGRTGPRRSVQIFDRDGTAVHKIYAVEGSNADAYDALVSSFRADDQSPELAVQPVAPPAAELPDSAIDVAGLRAAWAALKDTHDFFRLLGQFKVTRTQALRLAAPEMVSKVPLDSHRTILNAAAKSELPIMVFVGSAGCIEIHTGPVRNVMEARGWFNVLDPDFNLHLREAGIASAWIVRKPTADGVVTAVELYDSAGESIVQFFGKRKPGIPELPEWRALAESLPRATG